MIPWTSWGHLNHPLHCIEALSSRIELQQQVLALKNKTPSLSICHGAGRSYGDVALNPSGRLLLTNALDHFIKFNAETGLLECEAGVLLGDIQRYFIPQGWSLPVSPGTQFVTVGGAIANDVHGKNHHKLGTFGHHVRSIHLIQTNGCDHHLHDPQAGLFRATIGGLGLTGVIVSAQIQLMKIAGPWLEQEIIAFHNLKDFFSISEESERQWPYTVAWVDCSVRRPRGLFIRGRPAQQQQSFTPTPKNWRMPITPPLSLVNSVSLRLFNAAYFHYHAAKTGVTPVYYQNFLYPLDHIQEWNRMYGPKGFYQYQCLLPPQTAQEGIAELMQSIAQSGTGSFLAVLKTFGNRPSSGLLSFPRPGTTLALDFPAQNQTTHALFQRMDAILSHAGGCIYIAKDARMPVDLFRSGYPQWQNFLTFHDPGMSSGLSRRLLGV